MAKRIHVQGPNEKAKNERSESFIQKIWESAIGKFLTITGVIGGIVLLVTLPKTCSDIKDQFASDEEKFISEKFIRGVFIPRPVNGEVAFGFGSDGEHTLGMTYSYNQLEQGVVVKPNLVVFGDEETPPFNLRFKIMNNHLFISGQFNDLKTKSVIGIIDFNKWVLVKDKMLTYTDRENGFEVKDQYGYVVFNMEYKNKIVVINGYSLASHNTVIVAYRGLQPLDANKDAEDTIRKIKPLFPFP